MKRAADRLGAYRRGLAAETAAAWWLRLKGYRILARRFSLPVGEIDLIAKRGRVICFVEVKRHRDTAQGLSAITPRRARCIGRTAEAFLQGRPDLGDCGLRFDAVAISPGRLPAHLTDVWRPGGMTDYPRTRQGRSVIGYQMAFPGRRLTFRMAPRADAEEPTSWT